jgi:hypothetical protein
MTKIHRSLFILVFSFFSHTTTAQNPNIWNTHYNELVGNFISVKGNNVDDFFRKAVLKNVINEINLKTSALECPKIKLIETLADTVVVEIIEEEILTRRMGESGATGFLATVTFSILELEYINFVKSIFESGDHAAPGAFKRKDFENGFY